MGKIDKNKREIAFCRRTTVRGAFSFIFFISLFLVSSSHVVFSQGTSFYYYDTRSIFFDRFCYSAHVDNPNVCPGWDWQNPPPGKAYQDLINSYDTYLFLVSCQGLVNRNQSIFYLINHNFDEKWLNELSSNQIWLQNANRLQLNSLTEVINEFKKPQYGIQGSVVWDGQKPFTLALATTVAGVENLVIVRKDSPFYSQITNDFPVKIDLASYNFPRKKDGYLWAKNNYLDTHKTSQRLAFIKDGYQLKGYLQSPPVMFENVESIESWRTLSLDLIISKKAFAFDLLYLPGFASPDEPSQPVGEDYNTLNSLSDSLRNWVGANQIMEYWGFSNRKYLATVKISNWEGGFIKYVSSRGGVLRFGEAELYGKEFANGSFYQHGPDQSFVSQPPPISPQELLKKDYVIGYPLNFSFELGDRDWGWFVPAGKRTLFNSGGSHGNSFFRIKIAQVDIDAGGSIYQDLPVGLWKGFRYQFISNVRRSSAVTLSGRQVIWAYKGDQTFLLCQNRFSINQDGWQKIVCSVDPTDNFDRIRIQIYFDTPDQNYDIDEFYFLGPNTLKVNLQKRFVSFYMGDYDMAAHLYVVPMLGSWFEKSSANFPLSYGIASDIHELIPPIYSYYARTKKDSESFVMTNSGKGYLYPSSLPANYDVSWVVQSTIANRQVGYRTGWVLDASDWGAVSRQDANGQRIRNLYKMIAPEGIYYSGDLNIQNRFVDGYLAVTRVADAPDQATLESVLRKYPQNFWIFRTIFTSPNNVDNMVSQTRANGVNFEVVDSLTYHYLFKSSYSKFPCLRMTVISQSLPNEMIVNQSYNVTLSVRNDGWDIWTPESFTNCDGSGQSRGCNSVVWTFQKGFIFPSGPGRPPDPSNPSEAHYANKLQLSNPVYPGETVSFNFSIQAPSSVGSYTFQADSAKKDYYYGEEVANVPWQKIIKVVTANPTATPSLIPIPTNTLTLTPTPTCPPSPVSFSGSCPAPGAAATLNWSVVSGAASYLVRVDDLDDGLPGGCSSGNPAFCTGVPAGTTSYQFTSVAGHNYSSWIHSSGSNGCASDPPATANFTCQIAPTPTPIPGDIDGNRQVNAADLLLVFRSWLGTGDCSGFNCNLNGDNRVNSFDTLLVIADWGK